MSSSITTSFGYSVSASIIIDNKETVLNDKSINSIIISHDYDKNNMPVIYLGLSLESSLYNDFVLNTESARIVFTLYKFNKNSTSNINKPYIHDSFIYVMTSDPNYRESLEEIAGNSNANNYLEGYIGLMKLESLNDNKKISNTIIKNSNMISIVHYFTSHMNMIIEPFDNNDIINSIIIPPITSITNLLSFLNKNKSFYKSDFRLFRDFNKTYLLSTRGIPVNDSSVDEYNTIIINIVDPVEALSMTTSMEINSSSKAYIINVDATKTSISVNRTTDKSYNSIMGIDTKGNTKKVVLDIPTNSESTEKVLLERVENDNLDYIYNTKSIIESTSIIVTIAKTEIDSSLLTPNKEYLIRNYKSNSEYNGRYILSYKKEILIRKATSYEESAMFALRKVSEDE